MISSADYWLSVFGVLSFAVMVLATRRTAKDLKEERERRYHNQAKRLLGEGSRLVLSINNSGAFRHRVSVGGGKVYGWNTAEALADWLNAVAEGDTEALKHPPFHGGFPLHHPANGQ